MKLAKKKKCVGDRIIQNGILHCFDKLVILKKKIKLKHNNKIDPWISHQGGYLETRALWWMRKLQHHPAAPVTILSLAKPI